RRADHVHAEVGRHALAGAGADPAAHVRQPDLHDDDRRRQPDGPEPGGAGLVPHLHVRRVHTPTAAIERLAAGTGIQGTEIYGQTEQSGLVVTYAPEEPRRPNSMGRPLEQIVQTRLVPPGGGPDIRPGDEGVGELWVRGDAVTPGYWNLDLAEKWATDDSGTWLRTGDLMS